MRAVIGSRRQAGPLPIGEELQDALRECETIWSSGLLPSSVLDGLPKPGPLRAESIEWVEKTIETRLSNDVLALLSIAHPVAAIATGLSGLDAVLSAADRPVELDDGDEHADTKWVRISTVYSEPFAELLVGRHGGPYRDLCIPANAPDDDRVLMLEDDQPVRVASLGQLLTEIIFDEMSKVDRDAEAEPGTIPPARELIEPSIIDDRIDEPHTSESVSAQRVRHKKFGDGTAVNWEGEGPEARVTVAFDEVGTKKLLARFIEKI